MSIDLDRIIRFSVVADELSFTRAARRLNVDQPWLSRQVQQLEEQLGYKLFDRTTRRVALTTEGHSLLRMARELAATADRTRALARSLAREPDRQITIGVTPFGYWVPERHALMENFVRLNRDVTMLMLSRYTPLLLEALRLYQVDVAVVRPAAGIEEFDYIPIHCSAPGLLVPIDHPLAKAPEVRLADLAGQPMATSGSEINPVGHETTLGPFLEAGMELQVALEGRAALLHYARQHHWFAVGYLGRDGEPAEEGGFIYRQVVDIPPIEQLGIVRNKHDEREVVRRFWSVGESFATSLTASAPPAAGPALLRA